MRHLLLARLAFPFASVLLLTVLVFGTLTPQTTFAQCDSCMVDTAGTGGQTGFYPDPPPPAFRNQTYDDSVTFILPNDTTVAGFSVNLDRVEIDSITNLPPGLDWSRNDSIFPDYDNNPNGSIGPAGCIHFCGTPTQITQLPDSLDIFATVTVSSGATQLIQKANFLFKLPVYGPPSISIQSVSQDTLCAGDSISVSFNNVEAFRDSNVFSIQLYQPSTNWQTTLDTVQAEDTASYTRKVAVPDTTPYATDYRVRIVASNPKVTGQDNGSDIVVSNPSVTTVTQPAGCGLANGSVKITGKGGIPPFRYRIDTTNYSPTDSIGGLPAGPDTAYVQDDQGCSAQALFNINNASAPAVTVTGDSLTCYGDSLGSVTTALQGGTAPFQYSLNGGTTYQSSATFDSLGAGQYNVTVKDDAGCIASDTALITQPDSLAFGLALTDPLCFGDTNGQIEVLNAQGGNGGYQYQLNSMSPQNDSVFHNLGEGSYTVTLMDSAGCQQQATATLEAPDALQLSVSATNLTCHEGPEGSIQLSAQGGSQPYSYSVDSGMTFQASASFDSLAAGSYDILLEDNNKCQASDSVTLTQPDSIQYSLNTVAPNCFGGTGSIVLSGVSGGNGGFSYALDTGSFQQQSSFQGVAAGPHTVRIQDDSGCVQAVPVPLNAPDSLTLSITTTDSDTGTSNGTARVDASGGTAPYSYQWNTTPPQTMDSISGLSPGTYRVIVTDNNGCQDTAWATIELISSRADSHPQPGLALSIYPNPSKGEVHLEGLEPGHAAYQLHVYDAQGRLVRRQTLTPSKSQATLHLQALPAGLYNLRLHQGARSFSAQLLLR